MMCKVLVKTVLLAIMLSGIFQISLAQKYTTNSKKAIKHFEKALEYFEKADADATLSYINKAMKADNNFIEPLLLKAEVMIDKNQIEKSIDALSQAIAINPKHDPRVFWRRGDLQMSIGKYQGAKEDYERFLTFPYYKQKYEKPILKRIERANFSINAVNNPVEFEPKNLGDQINTKYNEYWPSLTIDEKTMIFTSLIPKDNTIYKENNLQEDFFISQKTDSGWTEAKNMSAPTNTKFNEGAQTISIDGKTLVFTACNRPDGRSCDLYVSYKIGERWTRPKNMGAPVNSSKWESQPSLSADGQTLYFISNRLGGKGGKDIWVSTKNEKGLWNSPKNMGATMNTEKDETAPFIHPDNRTLYFASNGHIGLGGTDIFFSRRTKEGEWGKPENMGYPINTLRNETALIVNAKGQLAYIASDRAGGYGNLDIYSFPLVPHLRATPVTFIKGYVYNSETKQRLVAKLKLVDINTAEGYSETNSKPNSGEFILTMPVENNFALFVEKKGYLFFSENYSLSDLDQTPDKIKSYTLKIPLQPIKTGMSIILKNIFFETDSYILKKVSNTELNKLFDFLKLNNTLKVEISGHTDNRGSEEHNIKLSKNRSKAVYDYLISRGVAAERLSYAGYGFSKPIADNKTETGRALNRRTEFLIVGNL